MVLGRGGAGALARRPGGRPWPNPDDGALTQSAVAEPTAEAVRQRDLQVEQPSTSHLCTAVSDEIFKREAVHQGGGSRQDEMEAGQRAAVTSSSEPLLSSHMPAGEASQPRGRELEIFSAHRSCMESFSSSDDDVVMTQRQGAHSSGAGGPSGRKSFGPGARGESVPSGDGEGAQERGDCGGTPKEAERHEGQSCGAGEEEEEEEKEEGARGAGISVRCENANSLRASGESDAKQHEEEAEKLHQPDKAAATSPSTASEAHTSLEGHCDNRNEDGFVEEAMRSASGGNACAAGVVTSLGGVDVQTGVVSWSKVGDCETFHRCCYDCRFGPIPRGEKNRPSVAKCRVSWKHTGSDWNVDPRYLEEELIRKESREYREYWKNMKSAKKGAGSKYKPKGEGSTPRRGWGANGREVAGEGEGEDGMEVMTKHFVQPDTKRKGSTVHEYHGKRARNELESHTMVYVDLGMLKDPSFCPISNKPLSRPVFCTVDGSSYDKHAISEYLKKRGGVLPGGALAKDEDMVQDRGMAQCVAEILSLRQRDYVDRKRARELEDEADEAIAKRDALRNRVEEAERRIVSFERGVVEGDTSLDMLALAAVAARREQMIPAGEENPTSASAQRRKETLGKTVSSEVSGWVAVAAAPPPARSGREVAVMDLGETDALKSEIGTLKHQMYSLTQTLSHVLNQRGGGALLLNQQIPVQSSNIGFLSNIVGHSGAVGVLHNATLVDRGNLQHR